ncbi:TPA: sulfite exporter TauE/SafE family protein, partial [Yersinia enterocolitica]|nr:sulfite exporter TauE/SafE family protein [Yersinia enterocolitica]
ASPVLALFIPIAKIVPLLAIVDMVAAITNVARHSRHADIAELKRLVPLMIIGSLIGATVLLQTRPDILLLALGIFVILYAIYSLSRRKPQKQFKPTAAIPFGLIGGIFSALFGSGGFIYAIYLSGRIASKDNLRITQTTLIGLSTLTRVILFALAGVYMDLSILWMVL